jgi:TetR/AcrR family transcriptional regulator, tetracycline repressor protein
MNQPTASRPRRGRRAASADDALTKEKIVAVALEQLDAHGLAEFSVRDVAKLLNVYPAAIYWHVPTRNQLFAEMVAHVLRDLAPPVPCAEWQEWLRTLFRRYRQAIRRHPNISPLIGAQLVSNAGLDFDLIERTLEVLTIAGFKEARLIEAFSVVIAAQVGFVTLEFAPAPDEAASWSMQMQALVHSFDRKRYPLLAHHLPRMANRSFTLRWQNGVEMPMDRSFEAYVATIIGGLEAMAGKVSI